MDNNAYVNIYERLDRQSIIEGRRYYPYLMNGIVENVKGFTPKYEAKVNMYLVELAAAKNVGNLLPMNANTIQEVYAEYTEKKAYMPRIMCEYVEDEADIDNGKSNLQIMVPQILDAMSRNIDGFMYSQYKKLAGNAEVAMNYNIGSTNPTPPAQLEEGIMQIIAGVKRPGMNNVSLLLSSAMTDVLAVTKTSGSTTTTCLEMIEKYCQRTRVRILYNVDAMPDTGTPKTANSTMTAMAVNYDTALNFQGIEPNFFRSWHDGGQLHVKNIFACAPSLVENKFDFESAKILKVTVVSN